MPETSQSTPSPISDRHKLFSKVATEDLDADTG